MSSGIETDWKHHDFEVVRATLDHYDPDKITVVIGTAALVLQGIRLPHRIPDVDVLAPDDYIGELKDTVFRDQFGGTSHRKETSTQDYEFVARNLVMLEPNPENPDSLNLLPFQAFTDMSDDKYSIDYQTAKERAYVHKKSGYLVLSPEEIFDWKARIGREKHIKFVNQVTQRQTRPR